MHLLVAPAERVEEAVNALERVVLVEAEGAVQGAAKVGLRGAQLAAARSVCGARLRLLESGQSGRLAPPLEGRKLGGEQRRGGRLGQLLVAAWAR